MPNKVYLSGSTVVVKEVDGSPGPAELDIVIVEGAYFQLDFEYLNSSGTAIDIGSDLTNSPFTEQVKVRMELKDSWTSSTAIQDMDRSTKGGIAITTNGTGGGTDGKFRVSIGSNATTAYTFKNGVYNIEIDLEDAAAITPSTHFDVDVVYFTDHSRIQDNASGSAFSTLNGGDRIIVTASENTNEGTYYIGKKVDDDDIVLIGNMAGTDNTDDETISLQKVNDVKQIIRGKVTLVKEV